MKRQTALKSIVFTDSGLGGLTLMADFIQLAKQQNIAVDTYFFNAQYSRVLGYKKMETDEQIRVFDSVLEAIEQRYHPEIIAIACNTLSVVYKKTNFYKNSKTKVLDIIEVGKSLIKKSKTKTIVELAMPTTIRSKIYQNKDKNRIAIATDEMLPDAIENANQEKINSILENVFKEVKNKMNSIEIETSLFLGCTHFPIIKEQFLKTARSEGVKIDEVLNPNITFAKLVFEKFNKHKKISNQGTITIQVVSRMPFQKEEINNIANLIANQSIETAEALHNYTLNKNLF